MRRQARRHQVERFEDRCEFVNGTLCPKRRNTSAVGYRIKHRTLAFLEIEFLSECIWKQQDVSKYDRGIKIKSPDRLQGHFTSKLWIPT